MLWNVYRQYQYGLSRRYYEFEHAKSVWESKTGNINMGILTRDICIEILKDNINVAAEFSMFI